MNASYAWLRAFVPFDASPRELRDLITAHTATVDELVALRADLAPIVVGRVVESEKIPDTKLTANKVDAGTGELLDVVCGAPNVQAGKLYPFAPTGTTMPGGLKIERRKIRGAVSNGMLCSARELGLGQDHEGIMELDFDVAPGTPFLEAIPAGDTRLVIDVLANRPDLLSHRGLAREIAAVTGKPMTLPPFEGDSGAIATPRKATASGETGGTRVVIDGGGSLVRRYMGIVIRGLKVGPSPDWLVARLEAVGSRSINNVVDATNYILWELGQPTHAFDAAKLDSNTVRVRNPRPGELLVTLDGVERKLTPDMTVIADGLNAVAIAGVMGGRDSEVTEQTTDIFLEVASFDPARTRAMRKKLGITTDASYRFERGVDPELASEALDRCVRLITSLAGGSIAGAPIDLYPQRLTQRPLSLRMSRLARVLGAPVPTDKAARLLRNIGCTVKPAGSDALEVTAPSWRADLVEEIDLIEEVARLHGYDALPSDLRAGRPSNAPDDPQWVVSDRVREALVCAGLLEVRPLPFVAGAERGYVRVSNPLAENESYLRRDVLETLARRAEHNLAHMQGNVRIFEIGAAFTPTTGPLPIEELRVACLIMGDRDPGHFSAPKPMVFDEWDARWVAETVAGAAYGNGKVELRQAEQDDANRLWEIVVGGDVCGHVERMSLDAPVWAAPAFGIELSLGPVPSADVAPQGQHAHAGVAAAPQRVFPAFRPLPATPASEFDLALLVRDDQRAADVESVIRRGAGDLLESLTLFDAYVGKGVPEGYRSLAWRLTLRHPERTLRDKEIEGRRAKILATLEAELDVRPRAG